IVTYDLSSASPTTELPQLAGSAGNLVLGSDWTLGSGVATSNASLIGTNSNIGAQTIRFTYTVIGLAAGESLGIDSVTIDLNADNQFGTQRYVLNDTNTDTRIPLPSGVESSDTLTTLSQAGTISGLMNGDLLTFRFSLRDGGGQTNAAEEFVVDNFTVNGTIAAVPEPSGAILLAMGAICTISRRTRRS
ncbi:PEP-CTERM sorting domain-containing protein, partial [bacterium]|nr:PEP-CTERM sorting domain-containing protein [bacterium]